MLLVQVHGSPAAGAGDAPAGAGSPVLKPSQRGSPVRRSIVLSSEAPAGGGGRNRSSSASDVDGLSVLGGGQVLSLGSSMQTLLSVPPGHQDGSTPARRLSAMGAPLDASQAAPPAAGAAAVGRSPLHRRNTSSDMRLRASGSEARPSLVPSPLSPMRSPRSRQSSSFQFVTEDATGTIEEDDVGEIEAEVDLEDPNAVDVSVAYGECCVGG